MGINNWCLAEDKHRLKQKAGQRARIRWKIIEKGNNGEPICSLNCKSDLDMLLP